MSDFLSILDPDAGDITLDASFAGVPFAIIDSKHPPSRRVIRFLFPGVDQPAFQDIGQDDGLINITGLLIGDDYMQQAADLESAFQTPGPATLDHPWLGNFLVVLMDRPEITFASDELRVARFTAQFARFTARQPPMFDTEESLLQQLDDVRQAAFGMLQSALSLVSGALTVVSAVRGFAASVVGFFDLAVLDVSGITSELLGPALDAPIAALANNVTLPLDSTFGGAFASLIAAPSAAAVTAAQPVIPAAVAPGGATTTAAAADARIVVTMLLGVAAQVAALPSPAPQVLTASSPGSPTPALILATQALIVADAVTAASDIVFTSQQDASTWLATLSAALDSLAQAAQLQGAVAPETAGAIWRAAIATKSALSIDMNATIGRLPSVVVITLPRMTPGRRRRWMCRRMMAWCAPASRCASRLGSPRHRRSPAPRACCWRSAATRATWWRCRAPTRALVLATWSPAMAAASTRRTAAACSCAPAALWKSSGFRQCAS